MVKRLKLNIYNKYDREDLKKAIDAVTNGMSCSGAERKFGVLRKTLSDHVSGRSKLERRAGRERNTLRQLRMRLLTKSSQLPMLVFLSQNSNSY